jgi:(R,R)-butanediol dehydrogenase / meso-butanediol dehydrogenase / diacetyl reductase
MMPAAVYQGDGRVAVEHLPVPVAGEGELVIEVSHCGICGSDLHFVIEQWGAPGSVFGHEYSGIVVDVGPGVDGWATGDRLVGGPEPRCGMCDACDAGRPQLCANRASPGIGGAHSGAFARYRALTAAGAWRVPDELDLRTAALTEPLAVALHGIHRANCQPGQRVLVTGAGPIGTLTVAALRALGIDDITVTEPAPARRAHALAVGARAAIPPEELVEPAMPFDVVEAPFHAAIECSGRPDAMQAALAQLAPAGTLVLSGTGMKRPRFDPNRIILNELHITGAYEYGPADYSEAIELLTASALPTDTLIEPDDVPLSGVQQAMERLGAGALAGKVLVVPREEI